LQCEVCGRQIYGAPIRAIIEGAKLTVCHECGKMSSGYWKPPAQTTQKKGIKRSFAAPLTRKKSYPIVAETMELVDDFAKHVRQAREAQGLSHEDLGRKIRERVSVLRKIEGGKLVPDLTLAEKLEHALKIKLRVVASEPEVQPPLSPKPRGTTLGDLIQLKLKEQEEQK